MTQAEARNAVNSIKMKVIRLMYEIDEPHEDAVQVIIDEVKTLETALTVKSITPNCRRATPDELRQLCAASNVVMFPAA